MSSIILIKSHSISDSLNNKYREIEFVYRISVVDSARISYVVDYYKNNRNVEKGNIILLKTYIKKIVKKNVYNKLHKTFINSLRLNGQKLLIRKRFKFCNGHLKNKTLTTQFDKYYTNKIKSVI